MVRRTAWLLAWVGLVAGCQETTKDDILERSAGVKTTVELREAIGAPTDRDKLGPLETWTYEASDGSVTFLITGDTVQLQTTGPGKPDPSPQAE
jgi:hypothetical protein